MGIEINPIKQDLGPLQASIAHAVNVSKKPHRINLLRCSFDSESTSSCSEPPTPDALSPSSSSHDFNFKYTNNSDVHLALSAIRENLNHLEINKSPREEMSSKSIDFESTLKEASSRAFEDEEPDDGNANDNDSGMYMIHLLYSSPPQSN